MKRNKELVTQKKTTLADQLNLTGTKPASMVFNGKEFCYKKTVAGKLYIQT